jgi:ATP-dependent Lon protease
MVVEDPKAALVVEPDELHELLGKRRHYDEAPRRTRKPGVSTGLAVTSAGGDVLFVEAVMMPGSGKVQVTGQVGDVMEESARAAVSWLRMAEAELDPLAAERFTKTDIHIHVPAGAIPKDGPSAGVAMATALASFWRDVPVRSDVAMTGEITLTGEVLPVGGVKEKALAAQRAKMRHVIVPHLNEDDAREVPEHLAHKLNFHFVRHVSEALELALADDDADLNRISRRHAKAALNGKSSANGKPATGAKRRARRAVRSLPR